MGTGIIECPHCHARIIPRADGECPSCRRDTADVSGVDPDLASLLITHGASLPPVCIRCGDSTNSSSRVTRKVGPGSDFGVLRAAVSLVAQPALLALSLLSLGNPRLVSVRVPVCPACRRGGGAEPLDTDFENHRMQFLVHRRFREALERGTG